MPLKLIPPVVYKFESNAEQKLFEALKVVKDDSATVIHSLNLPKHSYKQWAEADFVLLSPIGIMVLEVKGGRVACEDGLWTFTNRYGEVSRKSEGPFDQARSARFALENSLKSKIHPGLLARINFGFGVMLPDIEFDAESIEIPTEIVFDLPIWQRRDLTGWFRQLARYWAGQTGRRAPLTPDDIKTVIESMRPTFDLVPPMSQRMGQTMDQLIQLTELQYRYLDILVLQKRVMVEGGAGTGKTLLAIEAARRLADAGKHVLLICRSPVLEWHVKNNLRNTTVEVHSLDSLRQAFKRGISPPDVLIVDEGQDFLQMDTVSFLDSVIPGGFEKGNWLFFMDGNNQGSLYGSPDSDALEYIRSDSVAFPLRDNCRNTYQIALQTMLYTGGKIGRCVAMGDGLGVEETPALATRGETAIAIENQLEKWVDREGILPTEITILSPCEFENSVVRELSSRWRRRLHIVDERVGAGLHPNSIAFSSIRNFKGLESRCAMLIDLEQLDDSPQSIALLYVGMTRANSNLWIAMPADYSRTLAKFGKANSQALANYIEATGGRR